MTASLATDDTAAAVALLAIDAGIIDIDLAWTLLTGYPQGGSALAYALLTETGPEPVLAQIAALTGMEFVDLNAVNLTYQRDSGLLRNVDVARMSALSALPLRDPANPELAVIVATNPVDPELLDYLSTTLPEAYRVVLGIHSQLHDALALLVDTGAVSELIETGAAGVLPWVDKLLARAVAERASDLHLQYERDGQLRVRMRVDGTLQVLPSAPASLAAEIVGALMNKAGMDVSNLLMPQDGTFTFTGLGRSVDARMSMIPADTGASIVIRLLDITSTRLDLDELGASPEVTAKLREASRRSHGTIITSGPTGSGKTTTMWSLLHELDADALNILTVEDPIEYRLPGIGQTQVRPGLGDRSLTFAKVLRTFLRHDPDVILVGEIRDMETATVATEAAITGHLVLSTIHTPDAPSVFSRMVQMGVPRHMVAEALTTVCSQRLMRRLHACARAEAPTYEEASQIASWGLEVPEVVYRPVGCEACRGTGYLGRVVIIELIEPDEEFRAAVLESAPVAELARIARKSGYVPLLVDAMRHVATGVTSFEEVVRVIAVDSLNRTHAAIEPGPDASEETSEASAEDRDLTDAGVQPGGDY